MSSRKHSIRNRQSFDDKHSKNEYSFEAHKQHRLDTEGLFPNFRRNYEMVELQEQISKLKLSLELKDKQIYHLNSDSVLIKEEFTSKILILESTIAEQKKQLTELRYLGLKDKRSQTLKYDKYLEEQKGSYELQLAEMKQNYHKKFEQLKGEHRQQLQIMEQKMRGLLEIEKRDRAGLEELIKQKNRNYEKAVKQYEQRIKAMSNEKVQSQQETKAYQIALDKIKCQLKNHINENQEKNKNLLVELRQEKSAKALFERKVQELSSQLKQAQQPHQERLSEMQQIINLKNKEIEQLKNIMSEKDRDLAKFIQNNLRAPPDVAKIHYEVVSQCRHEGLIQKLKRNIQLKEQENEQLREQLKKWSNYIGFENGISDRTSSLLNASSEALEMQASFTKNLRKLGKNL